MKILVMSDSHSSLSFMRRCIDALKPDAMIHLGDHFDDGEAMKEAYPHIPMHQVPGNCDRYRCHPNQTQILIDRIGGVDLYMTHGHRHQVKSTLSLLLKDAKAAKADAVLYGHTHHADCWQDGEMWVLNPGSCGYFGGSVGLIQVENGRILNCSVLRESDLPPMT